MLCDCDSRRQTLTWITDTYRGIEERANAMYDFARSSVAFVCARARCNRRDATRREKERGREVGDLVRLEMTKRGVCISSRGEEVSGQGEHSEAQGMDDHEKEGKKKKKPELKRHMLRYLDSTVQRCGNRWSGSLTKHCLHR